jgi:predicted DNA-binding transcriptional regulator AlpA
MAPRQTRNASRKRQPEAAPAVDDFRDRLDSARQSIEETLAEPLMDALGCARFLGMNKQSVYDLVRREILPRGVWIRIGSKLRFDKTALVEWCRQGGQHVRTSRAWKPERRERQLETIALRRQAVQ